jgi:CRP-like cAMP-binding protein
MVERVRLLHAVRFFAGAPDTALPIVAEVMDPVSLAAGQLLFSKGDVGDSMYVVATGRLRIHDGDLIFNELGPGDVVGEMSVLDAEPRSASVTAVEATELFCLNQKTLYKLLEVHVSVAHGIIHILTRHLRQRVSDVAEDYAYIREVQIIAAAAQAIHDGTYEPGSLHEVAERSDALGQLARTFQQMADEVIARERSLRREVKALRIEIDRARQKAQVAEITDSDYFRQLQRRAEALRAAFNDDSTGDQQESR